MSKVLCSVVKNDGGAVRYQPSLFERSIRPGNHQRECWEILKGNPLGFDIRPFAHQLIQLRGRRKRGPKRGPIIPRGHFHEPSPLRPPSWFSRRLPLIDYKDPEDW